MHISIFDLFSIGIGPSSSHTVGPMKAAARFVTTLDKANNLEQTARIKAELFGSLALTGKGHGSDLAVILGLQGELPDLIEPVTIKDKLKQVRESQSMQLNGTHTVPFNENHDLYLNMNETLPKHTNGMRFTAFDQNGKVLLAEVYYSIGGGFVVREDEFGEDTSNLKTPDFVFDTAEELLTLCKKHDLSIAELMLANELYWRNEKDILQGLDEIASIMQACIEKGCETTGVLPGGLNVERRAAKLYQQLKDQPAIEHQDVMNWINLFAMAVNEENAAGGRIVTAPTNGAAGVVPATLQYYKKFVEAADQEGVRTFLLTAGAIAILYKKGASISGAEVGCQGEVGTAASMAAGALTAVLGGTIDQIENAAEIAMEHHLGMTCDPVKGLVQIPCIERNAMGAVKAINAARLAMMESGEHKVSLDKVIATMKETGHNMMTIYKETSLGGLAVNVPEC